MKISPIIVACLGLLLAAQTASAQVLVYELTLPNDGRLLQTFELPDYRCFQPNPQYGAIDAHDEVYVFGDWGNHTYNLVFPMGYDFTDPQPFPVFLYLLGGGFAWADNQVPGESITLPAVSWGSVSGTGQHSGGVPILSTQWFNQKKALSDFTFNFLEEIPFATGSPNEFISYFRFNYPDWGIIYPSYCSRDIYTGRGEVREDSIRWGFQAVVDAVNAVDAQYGIPYMVMGGNSAGGVGAAVFARDLEDFVDVDILGALISSGPANVAAWGELKDSGRDTNGFRQVELDDGSLAWVFCDNPNHDTTRGLGVVGVLDFSLSEALAEGEIGMPLYHLWGKRDSINLCADLAVSEQSLDRAIADLIDIHEPGDGLSVNDEVCFDQVTGCLDADPPASIGACAETVKIPCSRHGLLARLPGNATHFARIGDWIDLLVTRAEGDQGEDEDP